MRRKLKIDKTPLKPWISDRQIAIASLLLTLLFSLITWRLAVTANILAKNGNNYDRISNSLAFKANVLSKKSLELTQNDSVQDLQLRQLKEMYETSQKQLFIQNELLEKISAQLLIANRHYSLAFDNSESVRLVNFYKFNKALDQIDTRLKSIYFGGGRSYEDAIGFIDTIQSIVEGELENTYLTGNSDALKKWLLMAGKCTVTRIKMESWHNGTMVHYEANNQGMTSRTINSPKEQAALIKQAFSTFVDDLTVFWFENQGIISSEMNYIYDRN